MSRLIYRDKKGKLEIICGKPVEKVIEHAVELAAEELKTLVFSSNGVQLTVAPDSDPVLLYRDWNRALSGYIKKSVGPYPSLVLSREDAARDAFLCAKNELHYQKGAVTRAQKELRRRQGVLERAKAKYEALRDKGRKARRP